VAVDEDSRQEGDTGTADTGTADGRGGDGVDDNTGHYVTIFRSRLRAEGNADYEEVAEATEARARLAPGFVEFKTFAAPDGERVSIVVFDSAEHHAAWREDGFHRESQRLGRERFYDEFTITVCRPLYSLRWRREPD
jgi:heme-degrading monooxygenase HmoA